MDDDSALTEDLLKKKVNPNFAVLGEEALIATSTFNPKILRLYIRYGADIEYKGYGERTPLEYALLYCYFEGARILINSGAKVSPLNQGNHPILFQVIGRTVHSTACPPTVCIDSLINFGININYQNDNGETPLMMSVYSNNIEAADILIKRGADKTLRNKNGLTAMDIAVEKGNQIFIRMLTP